MNRDDSNLQDDAAMELLSMYQTPIPPDLQRRPPPRLPARPARRRPIALWVLPLSIAAAACVALCVVLPTFIKTQSPDERPISDPVSSAGTTEPLATNTEPSTTNTEPLVKNTEPPATNTAAAPIGNKTERPVRTMPTRSRAGSIKMEKIDELAREAYLIVVGEVVKVEKAMNDVDAQRRKRATVKVLRAITAIDGKPRTLNEITVNFPTYERDDTAEIYSGPMGNPLLETLAAGDIRLLPVKIVGTEKDWFFVDEEAIGNTLPAVKDALDGPAPATASEFMIRELVGNFVKGRFRDVCRAADYVREHSWTDTASVMPALELLDKQKLEESRWVDIAVTAYCTQGTPRPTIAALQARKGPEPKAQERIIQIALSKIQGPNADEAILRGMIAHQDEYPRNGGFSPLGHIVQSLRENFQSNPLLYELEIKELAAGHVGAMDVASALVDGPDHPLAQAAVAAARNALASPPQGKEAALQAAIPLLLWHGSDDDFQYLLIRERELSRQNLAMARLFLKQSLATSRQIVTAAGTSISVEDRVLRICGDFLNQMAPLTAENGGLLMGSADLRLCDEAGLDVQAASRKDFGLKQFDPMQKRDESLQRIRDWLEKRN
jgi:hypothetical protein